MSRVTIKLWFTTFTIQAFGVILAEAFSGGDVTHAARLVAVVVAVAAPTALPRGRVAVAARLARLTELALRPVLTLVTATHAGAAGGVIVTAAVYGAIGTRPSQVTVALVLRSSKTVTMNTVIVAGSHATFFTVSDISLFTFTSVGAVRVVTDGVLVTVVQAQAALVDVGALRVRPARVRCRHVELGGAVGVRAREVALRARTVDGVLVRVAPAAAHAAQARGALHVAPARLALAGLACRVVGWRGGAVQPLAAEPELVLAGVHAEAEALARGFAPHAAAALVQAVLAVGAQAAGRGAQRA